MKKDAKDKKELKNKNNKKDKKKDNFKLDVIRTNLSVRRTKMSCERALLAYISTACVFVSLAFTYFKVISDTIDSFVVVMFCIGALFLIVGFVQYFIVMSHIKKFYKDIELAEEASEEE